MMVTSQWLDIYKRQKAIRSDYQLARHWQIEPTRISQYRRGRLRLPLACILDIAESIGAEPIEIIISLEWPRAREHDKNRLKNAYFKSLKKTMGARMAAQCSSNYYARRR